ncbi:MAG: DUF4440 domain-containing protein [Saprospiraceae bacterium]|nr:DUF4440 domain-containing protein [Saprospiraceae bacterium]
MKKILLLLLFPCSLVQLSAQNAAERSIRTIMAAQELAWNRGDLEAFMDGYWVSDSLRFIGSKGLTYGWQQTLDNYKKGYPDTDAMGKLKFTILSVEQLSKRSAFVIGKWHLTRKAGDLSGHYTLLWKKIKGKWVIVADHSS